MATLVGRRAVGLPAAIRPALSKFVYMNQRQFYRHASSLPTITQPSFWKGLIPKPLRRRSEQPEDWRMPKKPKSKEWNPATFFIVIFLFIGSMSIQLLVSKQELEAYMRRADVRIGLLREVIEKLQRGEEVDVEKELGTGDAQREKEWEDVIREIESDDILKNHKQKEKVKQQAPTPMNTESKAEVNLQSTEPPKKKAAGYSSFF
ncbi:hypothetical protein F5B20DRAFT_575268 [Whalleya microplaca]|nr:hypothetical protein F5B20DRAFT_575268 [Whalleya microplaca]